MAIKLKVVVGLLGAAGLAMAVSIWVFNKKTRYDDDSTISLSGDRHSGYAVALAGATPDRATCDPAPPPTRAMLPEPQPGRQISSFMAINRHRYPALISVIDADHSRVQTIYTDPGKQVLVRMPIGAYTITTAIGIGTDWCNSQVGFRSGTRADLDGEIAIRPGKTTLFQLEATGEKSGDFAPKTRVVATIDRSDQSAGGAKVDAATPQPADDSCGGKVRDALPEAEIIGNGELRLRPMAQHFWTQGSVNSFPVVFMVDMTANNISLPETIASRAGITSCRSQDVLSPSRLVIGRECIATIDELRFGGFRMRDVTVTVLAGRNAEPLLGLNVLKRFHIEQSRGEMIISNGRR